MEETWALEELSVSSSKAAISPQISANTGKVHFQMHRNLSDPQIIIFKGNVDGNGQGEDEVGELVHRLDG